MQATLLEQPIGSNRRVGQTGETDRESPEVRAARRDERIDHVEAGKSALWRTDLRISQSANIGILVIAGLFLRWQGWSWTALVPAAAFAVGGMWAMALRMRPRESRLCRHMMFLARHRRRCADCRYCVQGLDGPRCPECGFPFDPTDNRHLFIPIMNRIYSQQGRQVGAVAIVAVMSGLTLLAQQASWTAFLFWSCGLLVAFHFLFAIWSVRHRRTMRRFEGCAESSSLSNRKRESAIDGRILRYQYPGLLLRWAFLSALVAGIQLNLTLGNAFLPVSYGKSVLVASMIARLGLWIVAVAGLTSYLSRKLQHRALVAVLTA